MASTLPFVSFQVPVIPQRRRSFLEVLAQGAAQTGLNVAGAVAARKLSQRDISKDEFQTRLSSGYFLPVTDERTQLLTSQGFDPAQQTFIGPDNKAYYFRADLQAATTEQQKAQERQRPVDLGGTEVPAEVADRAIQGGYVDRLLHITPTERSTALTTLDARIRQAEKVGDATSAQELRQFRRRMEADQNLSLADASQLDKSSQSILDSEVNNLIELRTQARADQEAVSTLSLRATALKTTQELADRNTGARIPLTFGMAADIIRQNARGRALLEQYNMVERAAPLSFMEEISALQTKPEFTSSMDAIATLLVSAGMNKDVTGEALTRDQLAVRLQAPDMRGRLGGYLLWSENPTPQDLIRRAQAGQLPTEVYALPEMLTVAEELYRMQHPKLSEGFLRQYISDTISGGVIDFSKLDQLTGTSPDETSGSIGGGHPWARQLVEFGFNVAKTGARGIYELATGAPGEDSLEAAKGVGVGADETGLRGAPEEDKAFLDAIVTHVRNAPADTTALRIEWARHVQNPESYRNWLIEQTEEAAKAGTIDDAEKARRLEIIRGATHAELREDAQIKRGLALEGIYQGTR